VERIPIAPRADWKSKVEALGLLFHTTPDGTPEGKPYWNEEAYYKLTAQEVETLERATNELQRICLEAVQHVIDKNLFDLLKIPESCVEQIRWAWEAEPPSIYGRFDLAFDGNNPPKMLEYNADTPTSLLEAAAIQWHWLEEVYPKADQFNSIWEGLVEYWKWCQANKFLASDVVHFAHTESTEDMMTTTLIRDAATHVGIPTKALHMADLGWDEAKRSFVDLQNRPIKTIFKLYPWEWLVHDNFGRHALETYRDVQWIEPIWKMLLSNKGILAILWELFPNHPNLLQAHIGRSHYMGEYVKKPLLSREGANVTIKRHGSLERTEGGYGEEGYVFQQYVDLPSFLGSRPVIGSWVIDGIARGIGIRESDNLVTDNFSRFVPHLFE
jgi:glutathionylspermidine synthase